MENLKKKRLAIEFLDNLFEFLGDSEGLTEEEITAELREEGIDVDRIVAEVHNFIQMKKDEQRLAWQKEAREERERKLGLLREIKNALKTPELFKKYLDSKMALSDAQVSTYYRKLKSVSERDEQSLDEDSLVLDLLEKIEKGEKK